MVSLDQSVAVVDVRSYGLQGVVVRMPYAISGRQFRAIRFESRAETSYASRVFDEDTRILLRSGTSTQGAPIQGPVAAGEGRKGSTLLTQNTVLDAHAINAPWMFERRFAALHWARYLVRVYGPAGNSEAMRVFGPAQLGGLGISPAVRAQLRAGQTLDSEAVTGMVTAVSQLARTPQGEAGATQIELSLSQRQQDA